MPIRNAVHADLEAIRNLLQANGLPIEDVSSALIETFLVAEETGGAVVGSAGLEQTGASVLMRSLAVAIASRGAGTAKALVARLEDNARSRGYREVWLLTTTAQRYFERAGYETVSREQAPVDVRLSRQFTALCPATAVCMRKRLEPTP